MTRKHVADEGLWAEHEFEDLGICVKVQQREDGFLLLDLYIDYLLKTVQPGHEILQIIRLLPETQTNLRHFLVAQSPQHVVPRIYHILLQLVVKRYLLRPSTPFTLKQVMVGRPVLLDLFHRLCQDVILNKFLHFGLG
jgi:hypothetical protein